MRRLIIAAFGLVLSVIAVAVVVRSVDLGSVAHAIGQAQPAPLLATPILVAAGIALRSFRWQRLLPTDGAPVPVRRIVPVVLVGYLGNAVLPARLGEAIRAYLLARREQMSSAEVLGTALLERIVDLGVLALLALGGAWLAGAPAWALQLTAVAALGGLVVVVLLSMVGLQPLLSSLRIWLGVERVRRIDGLLGPLDRFASGVGGERRRRPVAVAALISIPIWLVDATICGLVAVALGLQISPPVALLVVGVGALGTSIPSAPGYVGTYELAVTTTAAAFGVSPSAALALAVLLHAVTLLPVALGGVIALLLIGGGGLFELARQAQGASQPPR